MYWGKPDGDVACRMLGFSSAYEAISPTDAAYPMPFGEGTGSILLSDFRCTGTEANLVYCLHWGWGAHHCSHYEDAGLVCNSPGKVCLLPHSFFFLFFSFLFLLLSILLLRNLRANFELSLTSKNVFYKILYFNLWMCRGKIVVHSDTRLSIPGV